jgi:hypothetical protein
MNLHAIKDTTELLNKLNDILHNVRDEHAADVNKLIQVATKLLKDLVKN